MNSDKYPLIIVGASIAAISFIRTLRSNNDHRKILLMHGEDRLPYKRTKINKNIIRGFDKEAFKIADEAWYDDNNVSLLFDRVVDVSSVDKSIMTQSKKVFFYDKLLITTGAVSVLPNVAGIDKSDMHRVQNANDVDRLIVDCKDKKRFLIIGGGVEGIETADQLVRKGKEVIVANRMKHPLLKLFPVSIVEHLEFEMRKKQVVLLGGVSVSTVRANLDGSYAVTLQGREYVFDAIVACTGAIPNIELGMKAGLTVERGIVVDEYMQTSNESIYAAGDVAQHAKGIVTGLWHAAEHQGKLAALSILDIKEAHDIPPFRLKTEVFGLYMFSAGYENVLQSQDHAVEEQQGTVHRILYYANDGLKAVVYVGDDERAKTYQKAILEKWSKHKVDKELPIVAGPSFSFTSGF